MADASDLKSDGENRKGSTPLSRTISEERRWLEKCILILMFHAERQVRNYKWRVSDSADELRLSIGFVSQSLTIAKHKEQVKDCKTREEAIRMLRK